MFFIIKLVQHICYCLNLALFLQAKKLVSGHDAPEIQT